MSVMRSRRGFVIVFLIFFSLSFLLLLFFGRRGQSPSGIVEMIVSPFQGGVVNMTSAIGSVGNDSQVVALRNENQALRVKKSEFQKIQREVSALRDQFEKTEILSQNLLAAQIVGRRGFVPGVSIADSIVINKGLKDGVKKGQVVVYESVVLGQIIKSSSHLSEVQLVWSPSMNLTVVTGGTKANGILKGKGSGAMVIENVLLSDRLEIKDSIVTKGSINSVGLGFPPDLLVGSIINVTKKQSALFQSAEIVSPIDLSKIVYVFVLVNEL